MKQGRTHRFNRVQVHRRRCPIADRSTDGIASLHTAAVPRFELDSTVSLQPRPWDAVLAYIALSKSETIALSDARTSLSSSGNGVA